MRFFLDISLLLLIAVTIFSCWHKGFIRSVLGTAKTVISVVLTYMFGAKVSAFLAERVVGQRVVRYVHDRFLAMFEQDAQVFDLSRVMENLPDWLRVLFERTNADSASAGSDYANVTEASADKLYEMAESFARPISNIISDFLGYASVFLFSMLALTILAYILGKIADLPVIRTCDRLLGFLLGVLCAALYASVYTLLLFAILSLVEGSYEAVRFHQAFEQTVLFRQCYEYNLFRWIFGIG